MKKLIIRLFAVCSFVVMMIFNASIVSNNGNNLCMIELTSVNADPEDWHACNDSDGFGDHSIADCATCSINHHATQGLAGLCKQSRMIDF